MRNLCLLLVLFMPLNLIAEEKQKTAICSLWYASEVKDKVEKKGSYDKFKHCAVSCLLTLRCPATDVMQIGIYKELADIVGPGNAEMKDLMSNFDGIDLVLRRKAKNDDECIKQCHVLYPEKACP